MKTKLLLILVLALFPLYGIAQDNYPFKNPDLPLEKRLDDLISRLTVEEKISLLWEQSEAIPRLGVEKYYYGNEALHGIMRGGEFTVFPQAIAFGATFNPQLIQDVATAISDEARARWNELDYGKNQKSKDADLLSFFSPNINMARDPRWGRTAETYGEDPHLTSKIGVSFVRGLQGNDPEYLKTVATPKHYVANNVEENRFGANSIIAERTLREYYLPAFKAAIVKGNAQSIMSAYNAVNYVPSTANRWLLKDVLRDEWGFNGYVVSDGTAVCHLYKSHDFTKSRREAITSAIKAGIDMEVSGAGKCFAVRDELLNAFNADLVTIDEINNATRNVLRTRFKLGIFDPIGSTPYDYLNPEIIGGEKHQELALETARQSIVLLENKNKILPLDLNTLKSVAVIGHNANEIVYGGYSGVSPNEPVSAFQGIKNLVDGSVKLNVVNSELQLHDLTLIPNRYLETLDGKKGLNATYYSDKVLDEVYGKRVDHQINIHNKDNPPDVMLAEKEKSARWEGYLVAPVSGKINFGVTSDDGIRIWLEEELIIDSWKNQGDILFEKILDVEKGKKYKIKVEWYDAGGDYVCQLLWKIEETEKKLFTEEVEVAQKSDVVIAVIGTGLYNEREGQDKKDLCLPGDQLEMLRQVYKVNKNIVVVLVSGSQHTIPWIKEKIPAVLNIWYPGEQGGNALADVIFGKYNPAGRLPLTYYESLENVPTKENYEISGGRTYMYYQGEALWSFGHGLSYTNFEYSNLKVSKLEVSENEQINISVDIENVGDFDGDEVVQLYISFPDSEVIRPIKQLKGFKRIHLQKGEKKEITLTLQSDDLKYWSELERDWVLESTRFDVLIGASSRDIRLKESILIK